MEGWGAGVERIEEKCKWNEEVIKDEEEDAEEDLEPHMKVRDSESHPLRERQSHTLDRQTRI